MSIDNAVNSFMVSIENPFLTGISKAIHYLFEPKFLLFVSIIVSIIFISKRKKKEGIIFLSSMIIMSAVVVILKEVTKTVRPLNPLIIENSFSFPSGHVAASAVFFGLLFYLFCRKKSMKFKLRMSDLFILLMTITAFSRVYLRAHWLSDVLGGLLIGCGILLAGITILKRT